MPASDPVARREIARIAGQAKVAGTDAHARAAMTAAARAEVHRRDLEAVRAEAGEWLDDAEVERRAAQRRRDRMTEMSRRSVEARRKKDADREDLAAVTDLLFLIDDKLGRLLASPANRSFVPHGRAS